jgi:hypothetical protein
VFSFGAMIFEMLSEQPLQRTIKQVGDGKMPDINENLLQDGEMMNLVGIYVRCVQMDPNDRPTIEEVLQLLRE